MISQFASCGSTSPQAVQQYLLYNPVGFCINLLCLFFSSIIQPSIIQLLQLLWKQEFFLTDEAMLVSSGKLPMNIILAGGLQWEEDHMVTHLRNIHIHTNLVTDLPITIVFKSCKNRVRFMGFCWILFWFYKIAKYSSIENNLNLNLVQEILCR